MKPIDLNYEEKEIWQLCLKEIKKEPITLDDFSIIFHCNSYFEHIAGIDVDQYTTQSTLIGLDKKGIYHFITALEYITDVNYLPNSYETQDETFHDYTTLFSHLNENCNPLKKLILHYELNERLDKQLNENKKHKI